jgi:RNA polymerase sigma-70 factor, ECF subfamily
MDSCAELVGQRLVERFERNLEHDDRPALVGRRHGERSAGLAHRILPAAVIGPADPTVPPAADDHETRWLQPVPDAMLDPADADADPSTVVIAREHVELAFIAAIQHLPPRQRAVLLLREVMGYSAAETASLLDMSAAAVNSALQRARALLVGGLPDTARHRPSGDAAELVRRYMDAWHASDVPALVALMRADVSMAMPPTPSWYQGRESIGTYLRQLFATAFGKELRLEPSAANRQPAVTVSTSDGRPFAVKVFTVDGDAISAIIGFVDPAVFARFGL